MSEPYVQPPQKKGMSTGIKVLLGCLLAAVLLGLGTCAACGMLVKKGADKFKEMADDPDAAAYTATLWALKANPEVEVVASDEDARTITFRDKSSGKETTLNIEDIRSGRFSVEQDGQTASIDFEGDESGGAMKVTTGEGTMVFGAGDEGSRPDWIPTYPGGQVAGINSFTAGNEASGTFTVSSSDDVAAVSDFYQQQLEAAGFEVRKATMNIDGTETANLSATAGARTVNVTVSRQDGATQALIAYSEKQ